MKEQVSTALSNSAPARFAAFDLFMDLSVVLTGFDLADLQATGQGRAYFAELQQNAGDTATGALLLAYRELAGKHPRGGESFLAAFADQIMSDPQFFPLAQNIVLLWYCGRWNQLPRAWRDRYGASASDQDHIVSAEAYTTGLVWKAIDAHARGANPLGYGSWKTKPNVPETIPPHG